MEVSTASFVTTVVIGIVVILVVGRLLLRAGRDFLQEVYGDRSLTRSLTYMLVTLYHLIALGLLTVVATADLGLAGVQLIIAKTGIFLLILGGVYGLVLVALGVARHRRREEVLEDRFRQQGTDPGTRP